MVKSLDNVETHSKRHVPFSKVDCDVEAKTNLAKKCQLSEVDTKKGIPALIEQDDPRSAATELLRMAGDLKPASNQGGVSFERHHGDFPAPMNSSTLISSQPLVFYSNGLLEKHLKYLELGQARACRQIGLMLDRWIDSQLSIRAPGMSSHLLPIGRAGLLMLKKLEQCERYSHVSLNQTAWRLLVKITDAKGRLIEAELDQVHGQAPSFDNVNYLKAVVLDLKDYHLHFDKSLQVDINIEPLPPFTFLSLACEAELVCGFSPNQTLRIAFELFNGTSNPGVEAGHISYPLTDNTFIPLNAALEARDLICSDYGIHYCSAQSRLWEEHSIRPAPFGAVRPLCVKNTPKKLKKILTKEQFQLYSLIWDRFIASQMTGAVQREITHWYSAGPEKRYLFKVINQEMVFRGYLQVYDPKASDRSDAVQQSVPIDAASAYRLAEIVPKRIKPKSRKQMTESQLLNDVALDCPFFSDELLEGWAQLLQKEWVDSNEEGIYLTQKGHDAGNLFMRHWPEIFRDDNLATLQHKIHDQSLDGDNEEMIAQRIIADMGHALGVIKINANAPSSSHAAPSSQCPICHAELVIRRGPYGRFMACSAYPRCDYTRSIALAIKCPYELCDGYVIEKTAPNGKLFYGCSRYPGCSFSTWRKPVQRTCSQCGVQLFIAVKQIGHKSMYKCGSCKTAMHSIEARS